MNRPAACFGPRMSRAVFFLLLFTANTAFAGNLDFDKTFNADGEKPQIHYRARYVLNGRQHQVEVWRDRDLHLRRRADEDVETFVFKPAKETEWQMVILDLKRKIRTDVARTNLYRLGNFADWFGLAHSLARPVGPYQLLTIAAPRASEKPLASCRWYALVRSGMESRICWSTALRLPMLITDAQGQVQWRITGVDSNPLPAATFEIGDQGFVRNDANEDIRGD